MIFLPRFFLFCFLPIIAQQTILPPNAKDDQKILPLLQEAQDFYDLKKWDDAFQEYKKILSIDTNNVSAQLGIKLVDQQRLSEAAQLAREEREKMMADIDRSWEVAIPTKGPKSLNIIEQKPIPMNGTTSLKRKLHSIKLTKIDFCDISLRDAIEQLQQKISLLDTSENDFAKKGINIVLNLAPKTEQAIAARKINMSLVDLTLGDVLQYMALQANLKIKIEPYAVLFVSPKEATEVLINKEYTVSPHFIENLPIPVLTTNDALPPITEKPSAKEFLLSQGITFPPGATASYLASSNTLFVKNSQSNLDLIDSLVESSLSAPSSQIEIETRFLEVKQNKLQERGFDWLLGSCKLPMGSNISNGEGTASDQSTAHGNNYPFQQQGTPIGSIDGGLSGGGSVTSENRTGSTAITANALDALLLGGPTGPAAGVLALAGILTNPQFQVVLRAIHQQKGIDLLSAPRVTVSSGKKATISVGREFPYPSDYSPPQIPQSQGSGVNPAVPSTPSSFKTRNVGVELQVAPILGPDSSTIELALSPQIIEFQGFVNYGSPIFSQAPTFLAGQTNIVTGTSQVLLTQNNINQPVFSVRQVKTEVTLHDGQTVVLGGLMREDIQKVEDKTPIVGNLPLIGHLFRSSSTQHIKRNLLIFVTVRLLTPSGQSQK